MACYFGTGVGEGAEKYIESWTGKAEAEKKECSGKTTTTTTKKP